VKSIDVPLKKLLETGDIKGFGIINVYRHIESVWRAALSERGLNALRINSPSTHRERPTQVS
jgi:hypothetical protein